MPQRAHAPGLEPCAACGGRALVPHLSVAGDAGEAGLIPTTDRFGTALADVVRCATCGHGQLDRFPPESELDSAYGEAASDDYVGEEAGQRETARRALERIERHVSAGALLDLGPWVGFLLAEARDRGWRGTVGVEPSQFASAYARERLGLDVRTASLLDSELETDHFDAVVLGDVIEHLVDPAAALARISRLLRSGGVLCLTLPDAGSLVARSLGPRWWSVIPTHVHYFTRASATRLLERCAYSVLEVDTAPKAFSVGYYLERIGGYSPAAARGLVAAARATGVAERMWAPDFRDRMVIIARPEPGRG